MNDQHDVLDTAFDPEPEFVYGQIRFEGYEGFLKKGVIRYDVNVHGREQWHTPIIDLVFTPLDPSRRVFKEALFLRWTARNQTWLKVVGPAIQALLPELEKLKGLVHDQYSILKTLNGMYFAAEYVPRPDNKEGETWTTLKPMQVFADEAACIAVYEADTGKEIGGSPVADLPFLPDDVNTKKEPPTQDPQRATMAAFLPTLWQQANMDMVKLAELLKANNMPFKMDDPEVVEVMNG